MNFKNKGRAFVVYQGVWGWKDFPEISIEPNSAESPASYKFVGKPEDAAKVIKAVYEIENEELFDRQYAKAVSGNGNEAEKILTLHSSSRLALLTFYNVDEEHPITLNLEGRTVEFNFSTFEFKNPVIGYPSNMDVVLVSTDRKTVLFLESKLSEYYMSAGNKSAAISTQYATNKYSKCFYDPEWLESIGIDTTYNPDDSSQKEFVLSMKDNRINYLDGFKQMISHFIGISRRIEETGKRIASDNSEEADTILSVVEDPESTIYLGEILYDRLRLPDGCDELDPQDVLKDYGKLYSRLADKMNEQISSKRFIVLSEDLKYSEIFCKANIDAMTADFYG